MPVFKAVLDGDFAQTAWLRVLEVDTRSVPRKGRSLDWWLWWVWVCPCAKRGRCHVSAGGESASQTVRGEFDNVALGLFWPRC